MSFPLQLNEETNQGKSRDFVNQLRDIFVNADYPLIIKYYQMGSFVIKLQFLHEAFVTLLTPAFEHLEITATKNYHLTINIWDSVSTHTPPPILPWKNSIQAYTLKGEVRGYNTKEIFITLDKHTGALTVLNKPENTAFYWIKDIKDLPWWVNGSPLQLILHWWMQDHGLQLVHAAAVGLPSGGVLLAGKSGAGKSTTSLACLMEGMQYVSEDYCLIGNTPAPYAYSVYNSAKLEGKTLNFFPDLKKYITNHQRKESEKGFLFQYQIYPQKIISGFPLKALLSLKIENSTTSWLERISEEEGLAAIALSTMWQLTHTGKQTFHMLKQVATSLPCYCLHLGSELWEIPLIIKRLL